MSVNRVIVAGASVVDVNENAQSNLEIMRADSCGGAEHLLHRNRAVRLVCTDVTLPDGNWCDILRLVVKLRMNAEVRVIGSDGNPALRLEVRPHRCSILALSAALREAS